jgi:hypothetical protein
MMSLTSYSGVKVVLQWCYRDITGVSQLWYLWPSHDVAHVFLISHERIAVCVA